MGIKVESWQSNDGKLFKGEEDMLRHEINVSLTEEFPNLKVCIPQLMLNVGRITEILEPLATYYRENHPETAPETTLESVRDDLIAALHAATVAQRDRAKAWMKGRGIPGVQELIDKDNRHDMLSLTMMLRAVTTEGPIPPLVYWSAESGNFYGMTSGRGQGTEFYGQWYERREEFPTSREPSLDEAPVAEEGTLADG